MTTATTTTSRSSAVPSEGLHAAELRRDELRERRTLLGLSAPSLALIFLVMGLPTLWLFGMSFIGKDGFTLEHYIRMIEQPSYLRIFRTTVEVSVVVTAVCVVLGYPLAYLLAQLPARVANICMVFVILPFWTSVLVRTYAWLVLLQRKGIINDTLTSLGLIDEPLQLVHNYTGTVIGMVHVLLPFLILPLYASMKGIDGNYAKAAASMGASPTRSFWTVFFPLSLPGLLGGTLLVFVLSLGFYITPELLGGGKVIMVSMKIQQNAALYFNWGAASALGVVLLVSTLGLFWGLSRVFALERLFGGK